MQKTVSENESTKKGRKGELILNICLIAAVVLCLAIVAGRMFLFTKIEIKQSSMYPTFVEGEKVWISKTAKLERGMVVVFYEEEHEFSLWDSFVDNDKKLIKRAVAVAGDKIWVVEVENDLFAVKIKLAESGITSDEGNYRRGSSEVVLPLIERGRLGMLTNCQSEDDAFEIPAECFFSLGDNRNDSEDSRGILGCVPYSQILGIVV